MGEREGDGCARSHLRPLFFCIFLVLPAPRRPPASPTMLVKMVVKKALLVVLAGLLESDLPALFPHRASAPCPCPPHQRQRDACWEGIAGRKALPARAWRASTRLQKAVAGAAGGLSHHSHHHTTGSHHQSTNHRVPNTNTLITPQLPVYAAGHVHQLSVLLPSVPHCSTMPSATHLPRAVAARCDPPSRAKTLPS